jgi:hypothetical protein
VTNKEEKQITFKCGYKTHYIFLSSVNRGGKDLIWAKMFDPFNTSARIGRYFEVTVSPNIIIEWAYAICKHKDELMYQFFIKEDYSVNKEYLLEDLKPVSFIERHQKLYGKKKKQQ